MIEKNTLFKTCKKCGESKPETCYKFDKKSKDGRRSTCKTCSYSKNKVNSSKIDVFNKIKRSPSKDYLDDVLDRYR